MMQSILLLTWVSSAFAAYSYTLNTVCTTKWATTSRSPVPTVMTRNPTTTLYRVLVKATKTATITPPPSTTWDSTTSTSTNWIDTQTTDTVQVVSTTTSTWYAVTDTTISSTKVTRTTTTDPAYTLTVPTSNGFTAIAVQTDYVAKRFLGDRAAKSKSSSKLVMLAAASTVPPSQYPSAVTCGVTTSGFTTSTTSTITTSTTLAARTITSTSSFSTSVNSTRTLAPATSTTTSTALDSTTITNTNTVFTTSTSTISVVLPTSTYYAQCAPTNRISQAHGLPIGNVAYTKGFDLLSEPSADKTGYDCCALCASTDGCAGFGLHPLGICYYLLTKGQCDGSQNWGDEYHYWQTLNNAAYVVGNGGCGRLSAVFGEVKAE